jgi:hypothetical protein
MRSLTFPAADLPQGLDALKTALGEPNALTAAEEALLTAAYNNYQQVGGRADLLTPVPAFDGPRGEDLREAYEQTYTGRKLAKIRVRLRRLVQNRCPSCGGSRPTQLDHHAPKSKFAEFALMLENLVCSCVTCNQKKHAHVAAQDVEAFLHPYFDDIPNVPFIDVTIEIIPNSVRAGLAFDNNAPIANPVLKARMQNQFNRVDVNLQLEDEVDEVLRELADTLEGELPDANAQAVSDYLLKTADRFAHRHGEGFWKVALYRALSDCEAFCAGAYQTLLKTHAPALAPA